MKDLYEYLTHLVNYAEAEHLLHPADRAYAINGLIAVFGEDAYEVHWTDAEAEALIL